MQIKNIIEVKDISFAYNSSKVLDSISFSIKKGDYIGIVGPNGGGKTTLIKLLIGLLPIQSGQILIGNKNINLFSNKSDIGYVPQRIAQDNIFFPATVYEVVEGGRIAKKSMLEGLNSDDKEIIDKSLAVARISDLKDQLMSDLSGGQRQRVYVARALTQEPKILILDEPFTGVDVSAQKDFYAILKDLNEKKLLTIVIVSHDIDVISNEVKSILCLNHGLMCSGSPSILHEPDVLENLYGKKIIHLHH